MRLKIQCVHWLSRMRGIHVITGTELTLDRFNSILAYPAGFIKYKQTGMFIEILSRLHKAYKMLNNYILLNRHQKAIMLHTQELSNFEQPLITFSEEQSQSHNAIDPRDKLNIPTLTSQTLIIIHHIPWFR